MAPRQPAGESPHPARLRRILRHPQQHAVFPSHRLHRFAAVQRRAGRDRSGFLHHRRLRRARGRLDREEQGQAVVSLSAVQRPARAAAGPEEVPRALPEDHRREAPAVRRDDGRHGRRDRPRDGKHPRARTGREHPGAFHRRQRRPHCQHDLEKRSAPRVQDDHLRRRPARPLHRPVERQDPGRQDLRPPGHEPRRPADRHRRRRRQARGLVAARWRRSDALSNRRQYRPPAPDPLLALWPAMGDSRRGYETRCVQRRQRPTRTLQPRHRHR